MVTRKDVRKEATEVGATTRISLAELDKLRQQSRAPGPLPSLIELMSLLGSVLSDELMTELQLREKKQTKGFTATSKALGIEMATTTERLIVTIFLHAEGHEGFKGWPGSLGLLSFATTPEQARKLRGPPTRSGNGWDRWDGPDGSLHLQYADGGVNLLTLMAAGTAP